MDMDAFYASVEQRDNPDLKGRPVIVGGTSNRGVVSAASYEARRYGIRSAMPIFQARQRCPEGVFLPVRMDRYKEMSCHIIEILGFFSPLVEQVSIDEAYMDLSGTEKLLGRPRDVALKIKKKIKEETLLTCSIGIAPNRFLAKISSDMDKPDGLTIISPDDVPRVIENLSIEKVPGVGEKTLKTLHEIGLYKLGDVKSFGDQLLIEKTGSFAKRILALSRGIDDSPVSPYTEHKSISSEDTLPADTNDLAVLKKMIMLQSEIVGRRLRAKGYKGTTVTLKIKCSNFRQMTRSVTLDQPTFSSQTIYEQGLKLLSHIDTSMTYRLIGVGVSNLRPSGGSPKQLSLFHGQDDQKESTWDDAEKAMDAIKERFGGDAIKRGTVLKNICPQSD